MNKYDCESKKLSSRTLGLVMAALAAVFGVIGGVIVPVLGVLFALPFAIMAVLFFVAPESKVCRLILDKN
jgi:hypothetical protein